MKSSEQFAIEWNLSKRTINDLCNKGKIPGAIKEGRKWLIPDDAVRPVDKRVSSGKYSKKKAANNKSLPIGISDYVRAQADYYYVDKTLLIKEFLDQKPLVSLFTRPRRFGKTLNIEDREGRYPGIIMELKWKKDLSADELSGFADEALIQIDEKRYDAEMKEDGIQDILKFGIAFSGKKVSVKTK